MKLVAVKDKDWQKLKRNLLQRLDMERMKGMEDCPSEERQYLASMHRKFHYEVCKFFDEIEDA